MDAGCGHRSEREIVGPERAATIASNQTAPDWLSEATPPGRFGQRLAPDNERSTRMANTQSTPSHGDQCALLQFRAMTVKHG